MPIWITEYGHQTRPEDSLGVPYATQAAYIQQSISKAAGYPFVNMFIWFVYQDDQGQPWESGIYTRNGTPQGTSPRGSRRSARPLDARNGLVLVSRGTPHAAAERLHPPLLRDGPGRYVHRDDLACLPRW